MTQEIIEEYMVIDGKPVLVKKTVVEKEVPPDLTALKLLEGFYKMPDVVEYENDYERDRGVCYHSDAEIIARIEELIKEN